MQFRRITKHKELAIVTVIVHLSIGGNDWNNWTSDMADTQEETELFAAITSLNQWLSLSSLHVIHSKFILFYPYK